MNTSPPSPTLLEIASDWSLFQKAMDPANDLTEKEFRRVRVPDRLKKLVAKVGEDAIVNEINALLDRLRVSHEHGQGGFDCAIQNDWRGVTLGWLVNPYDDPVFRTIDPCRVLPSLIRLEKKVNANPDQYGFYELCQQVRRIISRTNAQR